MIKRRHLKNKPVSIVTQAWHNILVRIQMAVHSASYDLKQKQLVLFNYCMKTTLFKFNNASIGKPQSLDKPQPWL